MKKLLILTALGLSTLAVAAPAAAQVNHRQNNQQDRIHQGWRSGELTGREYVQLQRNQARIDRAEHRLRRSDGRLTNRERARIAQRQDRASDRIHRQKNDRQYRW